MVEKKAKAVVKREPGRAARSTLAQADLPLVSAASLRSFVPNLTRSLALQVPSPLDFRQGENEHRRLGRTRAPQAERRISKSRVPGTLVRPNTGNAQAKSLPTIGTRHNERHSRERERGKGGFQKSLFVGADALGV